MQSTHGMGHSVRVAAVGANTAPSLPSSPPPHPHPTAPDADTGASDAGSGAPVVSPPAPTGAPLDTNVAFWGDDEDHAAAVDQEMAELSKTADACAATERSAAKRRLGRAEAVASGPERRSATLSAKLRAGKEDLKDCQRLEPIVTPRKHSRPGTFNSYLLRALQRFALTCRDGAVLTGAELDHLYDLLDVWERTKPRMPVDAGHNQRLRDVFKSPHAFGNAIRDDVDAAVLATGWRKVTLI